MLNKWRQNIHFWMNCLVNCSFNSELSFAQCCRCPNKKAWFFYCVCTLTFTFLIIVCLKKWVNLARFCQVLFISHRLARIPAKSELKDDLLYDLFLSATCCPSLDVILVEGMHCCSRLVSTACLYFVPGKCLHRQHLPVVHMSSISTQIQVWCIDTVSNMLAGWRTQDSHKCWESFVYLDRSVL